MDRKLPPELDTTADAASASAETVAGDWRQGLRLGDRYVLGRFLGKGGMGQVWVAFDEVLDKEVALKRVRADVIAAGEALESLRREVLLAQTVTHTNVCRIYDLEPIGGDWVIKMELVGGRCLADLLTEGERALPLDRALHVARQIAAGLSVVHAVGIVHRDLKPHNIMVDDNGRAVLMDFGIARTTAPTGETEGARIIGTPEYMSPEQARGQTVDGRADLYALGCVLYRMIAGEVPFPAPTRIAAMARHLTDVPPDLRVKRPDTPAWLAKLIRELMAKSPAARPRDASAAAIRLAGPPPRWPQLLRGGTLAALAAVALTLGVVGWRAHVRDAWRPAVHELPAQLDAESLRFAPSPDARRIAYDARRGDEWRVWVADIDGANARAVSDVGYFLLGWAADGHALLACNRHGHVARIDLATHASAPIGDRLLAAVDLGRFGLVTLEKSPACEWCSRLLRRRADGTVDELVAADPEVVFQPIFAADGERGRLAYTLHPRGAGAERAFLLPLDPTRVLAPTPIPVATDDILFEAFAGPSTLVATLGSSGTGDSDLWEVSLDGKKRRQLTFGGRNNRASVRGGDLYYQSVQPSAPLFSYDYATAQKRQLTFGEDRVEQVLPTPDGRAVVLVVARGTERQVVSMPLDGASERVLFRVRGDLIGLVDRFVDGKLYFQSRNGASGGPLYAATADGHSFANVMRWLPGPVQFIADGQVHYAAIGDGGGISIWHMPLDGSGRSERDELGAWSAYEPAPSGGWRLAATNLPPTWGLFPPGASLHDTPAVVLHGPLATFSHDSGAALWFDGTRINRYELATGQRGPVVTAPGVRDFAESPDGGTLYFVEEEPRVRRQVITNFAARPPL
jgi:tRNA A-37 threonylcarbamoyl transferase component Bud32